MPFPKIVGALMEAGFEGYLVDYRQNTTIYYHPTQGCVVLENFGRLGVPRVRRRGRRRQCQMG